MYFSTLALFSCSISPQVHGYKYIDDGSSSNLKRQAEEYKPPHLIGFDDCLCREPWSLDEQARVGCLQANIQIGEYQGHCYNDCDDSYREKTKLFPE
ncbi:hypothetical protein PRIPAC_92554 [Pristionchus pacificus]|uniref:Uncharacterized protein n=1 Tax=Pristionchus pacificus TaxID=54126 RepID=A0A2A6BA62_PRIPA|nr:hypothetical protein PRIPAC_92554 [Pristionchus pacificus]|eukprot:PDM62753.1 hypothetical protein PRIPAC_49968 [Pristionchus pacificus]